MNPRQRRGVLLLLLTALCAIVVFIVTLAYVANVQSQVGPVVQVMRLDRDIAGLEPVTPDMIEMVEVPERWVGRTAIRRAGEVAGLVAASDYPAGTLLQKGMLVPPSAIEPGYREVALIVDSETGVAGKVRPGDRVDIIATIEATETTPRRAEVWAVNALVLAVGESQETQSRDTVGNPVSASGLPVTFSLPAADALRVAYVESFSVKLRLALRGQGDDGILSEDATSFSEAGTAGTAGTARGNG